MFGADPRDAVIETLRAEVARLSESNAKLTDRVIAMSNPMVYQVVKRGEMPPAPKSEAEENVERLRSRLRAPFMPVKSNEEIHSEFRQPDKGAAVR